MTRSKRRAAVAAGAIAATAALTAGTPGIASAADPADSDYSGNPLDISNILKQSPQTLIGILPTVPGALPLILIPAVQDQLAGGVKGWNSSPLGGLFPMTNSTTKPGYMTEPMPGDLDFFPPHAPGDQWIGQIIHQQNGITAPFGLGSINNDFYGGLLFTFDDLSNMLTVKNTGDLSVLTKANIGSVVGNKTGIAGPFGSALDTDFWLASTRENGVTTFTPAASISATAPFGLGNALFTFSPGSLAFGEGTFVLTGPSFGLNLDAFGLGTTFALTTGSVGVKDGNLVLTTPTVDAGLTTPLASGGLSTTAGTASVGLGGVTVDAPEVTGDVKSGSSSGSFSVDPGSAHAGLDGASVEGPAASVSTGDAEKTTTATVDTGSASVGPKGTDFEAPSASVETTPSGSDSAAKSEATAESAPAPEPSAEPTTESSAPSTQADDAASAPSDAAGGDTAAADEAA
ncbi:hypothetical protein [Tsukamurella sp. 1534]|uniref:hypothetical protein n=1 Tax=Tsukamurella sp. 1534 TaxID=1151061 RepID=UPI0005924974|nr:hypothetical protein [Tsukamurella sp. 1534]